MSRARQNNTNGKWTKDCFKCGKIFKSASLPEFRKFFYRAKSSVDGYNGRCIPCEKDLSRAYNVTRDKKKKLMRANDVAALKKHKARTKLNNAIALGKITKKPCEKCGRTDRIHGHHTNYSKPLEVMWLCSTHHAEEHQR